MPYLNQARQGATAFRWGDGVLVLGGRGEEVRRHESWNTGLPIEWLASSVPRTEAQWVVVPGPGVVERRALGQLPNGSLLEVTERGDVYELKPVLGLSPAQSSERT